MSDRLAYPNIPEQSIEVHIPLNITSLLQGPKRHYQLASTLQNTCDRFFKQTVNQLKPKRVKRSGRPTQEDNGWGTIEYRLLNMEYDGRSIKHIDNLCKKLYKGSTLPEPYAYYLMEKLKEQMIQLGVKYTFIRIHANEAGDLVFPITNASSTDLDKATALPTFSQMRDRHFAVAIVDYEGRIQLAPTDDGRIPELNIPIRVLCEE